MCEAQAGNLPQDDIVWCEGSQVLNLNLPPAYAQGVAPAPVNRYDYAYVISDAQSGILLGISATPDLSAFLPGVYSICGLSYLKSHVARLPTPDSLFTVGRLRDTLATYPPMFCGDLTPDCVQVTIQNPVLIFESAVICESECYTFYGETYCQSGIYVRQTVAGECDIEATLNLTVLPARQTALSEVRCSGECATTPGFENVCTPGIYSLNLKTWQNCDSIVTLEMLSLSPVAQIQDHGLLDCTGATFLLDGSSSSAGADIAYQWTWLNGGNINGPSDAIQAEITSAGDYSLSVCQTASGLVCCDTAYTTVAVNGTPPLPPADVLAPALICSGQEVRLTAISSGNTDSFVWTIPAESDYRRTGLCQRRQQLRHFAALLRQSQYHPNPYSRCGRRRADLRVVAHSLCRSGSGTRGEHVGGIKRARQRQHISGQSGRGRNRGFRRRAGRLPTHLEAG